MLFRKAELSDYKKILKFEKKVFKQNFDSFLPKVYASAKTCADTHIICEDNKKICGAICIYPMRFVLGDYHVSGIGIGSVAVDKKYRGQGIMKKLMLLSDERAKELGADIGELSGYRKRYERYGYVPCGVEYVFEISEYNIEHCQIKEHYTFRNVKHGEDMSEFYYLHSNQRVRFEREFERFEEIIRSWENKIFSVINDSGETQGYIITSKMKKQYSR